jgi:hypothetical protein
MYFQGPVLLKRGWNIGNEMDVMEEKSGKMIGIYLTKQGQNSLQKSQMIALLQLLRITNALRFHMSLLLHTIDEKNKIYRLRSQLEIYSIMGSSYFEAVKEFYKNLYKTLEPLSDDNDLKDLVNQYDTKIKNFRAGKAPNEVLKIIDYIRNVFSFHMDPKLFKDCIIEDSAKEDMLIGIARSEKLIDQCHLKAYDALIFQVARMAESLQDKSKIIEWLFEAIFQETNYFCDLMENFCASIVKKYGSKMLVTASELESS